MKTCKTCEEHKPETEFYTTTYKDKKYLLNNCKSCVLVRTGKNYLKDHDRQKKIRKNNTARRRADRRQMIFDFLLSHPCVDCGEKDPIVLEFDHLGNKSFDISDGLMRPLKVLRKEIDKCEVVCANCHKRRTAKRAGNWFKDASVISRN